MTSFLFRLKYTSLFFILPLILFLSSGCRSWRPIPKTTTIGGQSLYVLPSGKKKKVRMRLHEKPVLIVVDAVGENIITGAALGAFKRRLIYRQVWRKPTLKKDGFRILSLTLRRVIVEVDLSQAKNVQMTVYSPGRTAAVVVPSVIFGTAGLIGAIYVTATLIRFSILHH